MPWPKTSTLIAWSWPYRAESGVADVYFQPMDSTAFTQWSADLIAPLSPYLNDTAMTSDDYDLADFPARASSRQRPIHRVARMLRTLAFPSRLKPIFSSTTKTL